MAKKHSAGTGSITRLPSGNWRAQIMDGYTPEGKKNIVSFSGPTKTDVRLKLLAYVEAREADRLATLAPPLFEDWAERWYQDYKTQVQPSTYSGYRYTLATLKEYFGDKPIDQILPMHISKVMTELKSGGYSKSKTNKCRTMLIQIFDDAVANELLSRNPARNAKILRDLDGESEEKEAFREDEVETLEAELPDDMMGNSIRLMLGSGIRIQELLAFQRADIAPDGSSVRVNKAVKMVDGKPTLGPPKSKRGNRPVPIPERYRPAAIYLREHGAEPYLWTSSRENGLCSIDTFRKRYYRLLDAMPTVRRLNPHCCRHTYVTRLQARNVPMETIARLVGHGSIKVTDDYLHITPETLAQAANQLNG